MMGNKIRNIKKVLCSKRGMTLLETVLSVTLFAIVMTMVATMFSTSSRILQTAQKAENIVNQIITMAQTDESPTQTELIFPQISPMVSVEGEWRLESYSTDESHTVLRKIEFSKSS